MHNSTATATMPYPSLPASPTLTNPDMILPYGEYDSTPSPPRSSAWKPRPEDMEFSQSLTYGANSLPMTPITPIIYGNGTMLSDIGEVTEAESTPGVGVRRIQNRLAKSGGSPVRSSPTVPYQGLTKRSKAAGHKRTVSMESDSTVTTEGPTEGVFEDFDDTVSVDESAFQGDDEESVVDEGYRRPIVAEVKVMFKKESRELDVRNQTEGEEMSSAVLSRRAEMILANAKMRLDNMEGNLTRARSSLYITPSSSMSSIHSSSPLSRSTPSPPQQRIVPQMGVPPARHRQLGHSSLGPNSPGHARINSENSLPTSPITSMPVSRTFTSGKPLNPSPKFDAPIRTDSYDSQNSSHQSLISPLSRSSDPSAATPTLEGGSDGDRISPFGTDRLVRSSTAEPYSHHEIDRRGLTRSSSTMQMRDLSDKMKDLKGKISTLRDRAREDTMKRRSVQSLRTPSPFTSAEQWHASSKDYKDGHLSVDAGILQNSWNSAPNGNASSTKHLTVENGHMTEEIAEYQESEAPSVYEDVEEEQTPSEAYGNVLGSFGDADPLNQEDVYEEPDEHEDDIPEDGDEEVDEEISQEDYGDEFVDHDELDDQNYESEDGASLYHETLQTPISHEDREDAFDYEHFFLHSAMGTISQQRHGRRGSVDSFMSEDSVETTRGPEASSYKDHLRPVGLGHRRQQSADTVSTMATFATAKEGYSDEAENDILNDYAVQDVLQTHAQEAIDTKYSSPAIAQGSPEQQSRSSAPNSRPSSVIRDGIMQPSSTHRPSVSSFASTSSGTTRSFPLVNKPKPAATTSAPATTSNSPSQMYADPAAMLGIALTTGMATGFANGDGNATTEGERAMQPSPVSMLHRDDQILVERLVASMGKCVLGLQEARRGSAEGRMWRRRLDVARRALEENETLL